MREYPLESIEAMVVHGSSLESIEHFIADRSHLPGEVRSALWLLAWTEISRDNRRQRVADLIAGRRQLAGRVDTKGRVDRRRADGTDRPYPFGLGIGA